MGGDELLDMYQGSAVVGEGGSGEVGHNASEEPDMVMSNGQHNTSDVTNISTSNDGLGAFLPSTSFHDFAAILQSSDGVTPESQRSCSTINHSKQQLASELSTQSASDKSKKRKLFDATNTLEQTIPPVPLAKKRINISGAKTQTDRQTPIAIGVTNDSGKPCVTDAEESFRAQSQHDKSLTSIKKESRFQKKSDMPEDSSKTNTPDPLPLGVTSGTKVQTAGLLQMNKSVGKMPAQLSAISAAACQAKQTVQRSPASTVNQGVTSVVKVNAPGNLPMISIAHPPSGPVVTASSTSLNQKTRTIVNEETFKGVAQAAVSNLILSAGNKTPNFESGHSITDDDSDSGFHLNKPVDTSTAHVSALTSTNWVAACAASVSGAPPGSVAAAQAAALAAANDPAAAKAARARRSSLTVDERARQNRDRNREHARNTRLRKKAYVEELKRTLTELVAQRDTIDLEKRHEKQRDMEVREVRYRVMEEFLKLRARGAESNLLARWVAILEDGFSLTLPKTDYRATVQNKVSALNTSQSRQDSGDNNVVGMLLENRSKDSLSTQKLRGATESMEDAANAASFVNSVLGGASVMQNTVCLIYQCDRKNFIMDGVNAVLNWTLTTSGGVMQGAKSELFLQGSMRASFSPASNKLVCAELLFDTGCIVSQLKSLHVVQPRSNCNVFTSPFMSETDALLDSIQVPHLSSVTTSQRPPASGNVTSLSSTVSVCSTDKEASSSDDEMLVANNHVRVMLPAPTLG